MYPIFAFRGGKLGKSSFFFCTFLVLQQRFYRTSSHSFHSSSRMAFSTSSSSGSSQERRRLVLIGGGHAHVQVIKALNKASRPDYLDVTLIDLQKSASYSGMVPGTIAGAYTPEETLLHLSPLADWAGIHFINKKVVDIDLEENLIHVEDDPSNPIHFDAVSLDIGSASRGLSETKGAQKNTIPTRPISKLVERLDSVSKKLEADQQAVKVVVIGGGAAGTELSMSIKGRWGEILGMDQVSISILDSGDCLLPGDTKANRDALLKTLDHRGINIRHRCTVDEVLPNSLRLMSGEEVDFDYCIWATGAGSHDLAHRLGRRGLATSDHGWIRVNKYLQSVSHPQIFAAGDCCTIEGLTNGSPPKAGVYAVRSGPILIENLTRFLHRSGDKQPSKEYNPQDDFLKLMVCGDGTALGFRFGIPFQGKWVFDLKNEIDSGFMNLFKTENLPELEKGQEFDISQYDDDSKKKLPEPLPARDAAGILQRTDDEVDFWMAWSVIRKMSDDEQYRNDVLARIQLSQPETLVTG